MATNSVIPAAPAAVARVPATAGEDMAETLIGSIEADFRLAAHRRALAYSRNRIRIINQDFLQMIAELNADYSEPLETLVRLSITGSRKELVDCYLSVQRDGEQDPAVRKQVETMVDQVIEAALAKIVKPDDKKDGKGTRPTRSRAAD